ncbi:Ig-like domain-containing protein [Pyxidicoccus sp. 3LFB2]
MTVTSSGPGIPSVTQDLTQTQGRWGGVVTDVPAGTDRRFLARAFDSNGGLLYQGQSASVTIIARQTALVAITLQEVNPPAPFGNEAPVIGSVVASRTTVPLGNTVTLTASASDPNPTDTLTYNWMATQGSFSTTSAASTTWTAPSTAGIASLTFEVRDSQGTAVAVTLSINVTQGTDEGGAALDVQFNNHPVVARVHSTSARVNVGQAAEVTVMASDSDSDTLSYQWTASCSGSWTQATSSTARFTPSSLPSRACNNCQLTVAVSDGKGGSTTGSLSLCVVSTSPPRFPPSIVRAYQSSPTATPGQTLSFQVEASDPQGSTLSFQWSADIGLMGTATSATTRSSNTWDAPRCVPAGAPATITATVTNAYGLSDTTRFPVTGLPTCTGGRAVFSYTGADQSWTVPTGVNRVRVKLWGAGGGAVRYRSGSSGGGGALATAILGVNPGEPVTVIVGGGGTPGDVLGTPVAAYGGGGANGVQNGAGGGGRSAIRRSTSEYATAGGGGGAGADSDGAYSAGGAGGARGLDGKDGATTDGTYGLGGKGAFSHAGGAGGTSVGTTYTAQAGSQFKGGDASTQWWSGNGGGGGGGYFGGGAGGADMSGGAGGGGGGGSSYAPDGSVLAGNGRDAGGMQDADYVAGIGMGAQGGPGGHGRVVISYDVEQYPLSNAMRCRTRPSLNQGEGQLACYGVWDYGDAFGNDMDMCEDYSTPRTGCVVSTPACASGRATAVEHFTPSSASKAQLSAMAANLGVSTQLLKEGLARAWVYNCSSSTP